MAQFDLASFDAVAFDVEGTLFDTIPAHHTARMAAFEKHGYGHITREEHERGITYGSSYEDIVGGILHMAGIITKDQPFNQNPVVKRILAYNLPFFTELAGRGFDAMPGAVDFVHDIASHFVGHLALVTSSAESLIRPSVERYGLSDYFPEAHIIGEKTTIEAGLQGKPAGDPYRLAMERMGSKNLLAFEDTVSGVASAKRAGATVIGLGFSPHSAVLFASGTLEYPPDAFVRDYSEARQLLGLKGSSAVRMAAA